MNELDTSLTAPFSGWRKKRMSMYCSIMTIVSFNVSRFTMDDVSQNTKGKTKANT